MPVKWLSWSAGCVVCFICIGCVDSVADKSLPAPLRDAFGYTLLGQVPRTHGGGHFELVESEKLHYVRIRGISCPKFGQEFFRESWLATRKMIYGVKTIRIEVVDRDESMIEIADVFEINDDPADIEGDRNVGLELLRQGLAWFDGSEFENASQYKQAESEAKASGIGIWSHANPLAPWEFEAQKQK